MRNNIKFVYFDLGGVLFRWKESLDAISKLCNVSLESTIGVFDKYDNDACRGRISPKQFWEIYKKELNVDIKIENFIDWWTNYFSPIPESHKLVMQLAKKYDVGLLTNIYKGAYEENVKKGHIPHLDYAAVIESCDLDMVKPEREFFLHAQKKTGVKADEIFFIDDKKENIEATKKLGWQGMVFEEDDPKGSVEKIEQKLSLP